MEEVCYTLACRINSLNLYVIYRRHWLFGDRIDATENGNAEDESNDDKQSSTKKKRTRGWFPRRCAVELVDPDSEEHQRHFCKKNKDN